MTPEEYQLYVNLVRDRYQYLNLTFEQAEKIYEYEEDRDKYSNKHHFSVWEEWDYELTTFREILNDEQLKTYETVLKQNIQRYEQGLIEQDSEMSSEFEYHEDLINFYETQFLPDFFKNPLVRFGWLLNDQAKIEYLRTEYKYFLNDTKKEILTNHFRHNRTFKPNELKASLLRHKRSYIFPDYSYFKYKMDEPTRAVVHYLKPKLRHLPENTEQLLTKKIKELKEFNEINFKKHFGEIRGWHVVATQLTDEEQNEHNSMTLLLLDKEKYGLDGK